MDLLNLACTYAKFYVNLSNESPLQGEKPQNRHLSNLIFRLVNSCWEPVVKCHLLFTHIDCVFTGRCIECLNFLQKQNTNKQHNRYQWSQKLLWFTHAAPIASSAILYRHVCLLLQLVGCIYWDTTACVIRQLFSTTCIQAVSYLIPPGITETFMH